MKKLTALSVWILFLTIPAGAAKTKKTPEEQAAYWIKHAKPIPDDQWQSIAGPRISEKYSIVKGDSLSEISMRLFGDMKYWPKIWAFNNDSILNPHKIAPGNAIAFSSGTANSLPSISVKTSAAAPANPIGGNTTPAFDPTTPYQPKTKGPRSMDWKSLPRQSWETFKFELPPEVDPLGFDRNNKITFHPPTGFDPTMVPATEKIPFLGQIVGSRSESAALGISDTVYIRADKGVQVGESYAVTLEPSLLKSPKSDRVGYSYIILGKVKILGVRDHLYVGTIISAKDTIPRGSSLVPLPPRIPVLTPIPGPRPVQGILIVDHTYSTYAVAQHKEVFIDRGSDDGVKPGMIFRAYEHYDPSTDKKLTSADFIIDADIQVTQVTETMSSGIVIENKSLLIEGSKLVLLTDVSDLLKNPGFRETGDSKDGNLNELDQLDTQDTLGLEERKELKQLENWKNNPEEKNKTQDKSSDSTPPPPVPTVEALEPPPPGGESPPPIAPDPGTNPTPATQDVAPPPGADEGLPELPAPTLDAK